LALTKHLKGPMLGTKHRLSALPILDVGIRAVSSGYCAHVVAQRHSANQKPAVFAVSAPHASFSPIGLS
jgi:hypothetical protein